MVNTIDILSVQPMAPQIPAYNTQILNYNQGIKFTERSYGNTFFITTFDTDGNQIFSDNTNLTKLFYMMKIIVRFLEECGFDQGDLDNAEIAGGFVYHVYRVISLTKESFDEDKYSDIDIYVSTNTFQKLLEKSKIDNTIKYAAPNLNKYSDDLRKNIQFINKNNHSIQKVIDSYDLDVCKCYISKFNQVIADERIKANEINVDHLNQGVGPNRSFERIEKYINRYKFDSIKMSPGIMSEYIKWKVNHE